MATTNGIQLLDEFGNPITGLQSSTGLKISGSITATNPSVAATGGFVPAQATYLGGKNAGNLTGLLVNADGTLQLDIEKVLGSPLSVNNPLITSDMVRTALVNGTLYSLGSSATSAGVSAAAIALFGGAGGIAKNTLILSILASSIGNQDVVKCGTLTALDANVATNTTPTPLKAGGSASLYTGSNAAINFPTGTSVPAYTGSFYRFITQNANVSQELAIAGVGLYYIPANTANAGFEAVLAQGSAGGIYALNLIWAEF